MKLFYKRLRLNLIKEKEMFFEKNENKKSPQNTQKDTESICYNLPLFFLCFSVCSVGSYFKGGLK